MASTNVKANRMKRMLSRKSHSWWWDSHISPKNSKWLQENLEEMDQRVKQMLKLIEEDADSFAKKAEMYYQKRPELISLVEDFYRMYRSLAERYDHVTGELRKNIPSDLQSQGSGISEVGSEPPSTMPSPDRRPSRHKSGHRAAGFNFFLGGNGTDLYNKEGDESSTLDSDSESDDSFGNNHSGSHGNDEEQGLRQRIVELEVELQEVKEQLQMQEEGVSGCALGNYGDAKFEGHEKMAKYEEEINSLKIELQRYMALADMDDPVVLDSGINASDGQVFDSVQKIQALEEELRISQEKLRESEEEVVSLKDELKSKGLSIQNFQEQLKSAQEELSVLKNELEKERGVLYGETPRFGKERDHMEDNLKGMDAHCQVLEEELKRAKDEMAEMKIVFSSRIEQLKAEISKKNESMEELKKTADVLQSEKDDLITNFSELANDVNFKDDQIDQMSRHLHELHMEHVNLIEGAKVARKSAEELRSRIKELEREVEKKQQIIAQGAEEKREAIRQLCFSLEHYRNGYHRLREVVTGQKSEVAN